MPEDTVPENKLIEMLEISQLPTLSRLIGASSARLTATVQMLKRLVAFTGLTFGFEIPEAFSGYDPGDWEAFIIIEKLKRIGWVESAYPIFRLYPDEPRMFQYVVMNKENQRLSGANGSGMDFLSKERALWAAVGEAIERRALFTYKPTWYLDAAYSSVKSKAIRLNTLAGIDRKNSSVLNTHFDDTSIFRWIKGRSLITKQDILLPLQLIFLECRLKETTAHNDRNEPLLRIPVSTGAAAHTDSVAAMLGGTLELLERDAFMIAWMNMLSPAKIKLESVPSKELQAIFASFTKYNLQLTLLYLPTDFNIHVVLAAITDSTGIGPALNLGASAGFDLTDVIEKAISEAQASRMFVRRLMEGKDGKRPATEFTSPSQIGRDERLFYWADPVHTEQASFLFKGQECDFSFLPTCASLTSKQALDWLRAQFKEKNMELLSVPLLESEMEKELGFVALQMVAPELQPMHLLEVLPYNWGARLDSVPPLRGYSAATTKNSIPHPFP
jgi:ribosomal protein S12 methylthiotransferase accessory factor